MTVKELMDFLKESPEDMPVVLSKDPEGNGFREMQLVQEAWCKSGKWGNVEIFTDEKGPRGSKACVVLWP